jgi:pre-rRNA-processing protein TSR1
MEAAWLGEEVDDDDDKILSEMCDWGKEEEETDQAVFTAKKPELEQRTREEMDFVDEVDTPQTVSARERFQKYRGLKSLRNGNWDPYEELPVEFSQIHEFQDMQFAAKEGFGLISEAGKLTANKKCRLVLEPTELVEQGSLSRPLIASTLAVNECKVTVVHARVQRLPETMDEEISSKSPVTVQCGFRRIEVRPIYSDIPKYSSSTGTCPIQRMHRKLPNDTQASIMMSFYAPAIFGSCPVIVFEGDKKLMWGSVAGCAPNKPVVVKRITLTGYPFRVHQTRAVIRFMFFSPTDIDWFKPVELTTKKGLRGHISESLGTHGYMKCRFNGQLTSDDIVCMHLYKRVYPKWHSVAWTSR